MAMQLTKRRRVRTAHDDALRRLAAQTFKAELFAATTLRTCGRIGLSRCSTITDIEQTGDRALRSESRTMRFAPDGNSWPDWAFIWDMPAYELARGC